MNITRIVQALFFRLFFWGRYRCNVCGHRVGRFLAYRGGSKARPGLMRALNVIGSDMDNFECPWCGAHDRERHLIMYMQAARLFDKMPKLEILHFAPERRLSRRISATHPVRYIRCDLDPSEPGVEQIDILNTLFADESFDLIIANHVLEHVSDDAAALREIRRILKPGGYTILQTPFSPDLYATWSDNGIDNNQSRRQAYGQEDHVRLFGRDIFDRITSAGFISKVAWHKELFHEEDRNKYGVNLSEPFFLFERAK